MRICVITECRMLRTPDGAVWTQMMQPYSFWTHYLEVFTEVLVVTRIADMESVPEGWKRVNGEGVSCFAIPYFLGPWQYLLRSREVGRAVRQAVEPIDALLLRVPSQQIAASLEPLLHRTSRPYAVEVLADPHEVYAPGALGHPLAVFFKWLVPRQMRRQIAGACAVSYVTKNALQRRYPPPEAAYCADFSDIELPEEAFAATPRALAPHEGPLSLISVGTLGNMNKGIDVLIDAISICADWGVDLRLAVVGDGKHRPELEEMTARLGLTDRVKFLGQLSAGEAVRAQLDAADIFVMPSKTEGLPRAMIEAMARALPCIGSDVGGIPELLAPEDLVPLADAMALAETLRKLAPDTLRRARMSERNLSKAAEYRDDVRRKHRVVFYECLRERTQHWLSAKKI